jgi:multiple sugar transport system permease protein
MKTNKKTKINQNPLVTFGIYFALIFFLLFTMLPFYVIIANSITPTLEISDAASFVAIPSSIDLLGFTQIFTFGNNLIKEFMVFENVSRILTGFYNMFWQVVPKSIISLFVSGLAGYSYCKLKFKLKNFMFAFMLTTMMIPMATMTFVSFTFYVKLGWYKTVLPLIVPGLFGGAGTIFFMKQFFEGVPTEILEAARIDGLGEISIYFKIAMPLAMPAFISQFILTFIGGYNSYTGPLLYLDNLHELYPLQLVLQKSLTANIGASRNEQFVSSIVVIAILPILLIYLFGQKFFISGITSGAVKG